MGIVSQAKTGLNLLRQEGTQAFFDRAKEKLSSHNDPAADNEGEKDFKLCDVLFVNGCGSSVPHPIRYRVDHQCEQLAACGMSTTVVNADELTVDHACVGRTIIIFRCPYTEVVGDFIKRAKELNKKVYFDIDDLVIDTCYTDQVKILDTFSAEERAGYDEGVRAMKKTLMLCDGSITTTTRLAEELSKYVPEVFVNRNTASEKMLALSQDALKNEKSIALERSSESKVIAGYFSGSITHNDDFALIIPPLVQILDELPNFELLVVGELDVPRPLEPYLERIHTVPFIEWEKLPGLIASVDINLAPLEDTIFNEAKSENKWVEAALVKVPTVASRVGAFSDSISDKETGLLCSTEDEWYKSLKELAQDLSRRKALGESAYRQCIEHCTTISAAPHLARYIRSIQTPNLLMVLPGFSMSGGILVALHHCALLQEAGIDVTIFNRSYNRDYDDCWYTFEGRVLPVFNHRGINDSAQESPIRAHIDRGVATFWSTLTFLRNYDNVSEIFYLVQGHETDFYQPSDPDRLLANSTYEVIAPHVNYVAVSQWCFDWLKEKHHKVPARVRNGLSTEKFLFKERDFSQKIRILIEGDCDSHFKNIDESFSIVDNLDPARFEVWYMSNQGRVKPYYRIDRNLGSIPYDEVGSVYSGCHILIKTSIFEGFSYPPLEMMATGGIVVACINDGNAEYLENEVNALIYPQGDIDAALECIHRVVNDATLRAHLVAGGRNTAEKYAWSSVKEDLYKAYLLNSSSSS